jgi:hypothetical protein
MVCIHCGARLEENSTGYIAISDPQASVPAVQAESFIDVGKIPKDGIGVHIAGETKPIYVSFPWELILGRKTESETNAENFLDLTDMHATNMGVSRRHAMIRRTISGFVVMDLASRNGTWLNAERLTPHKPYPLASGSQLRIGNMRMLIMHRAKTNDTK